MGLYIHRNQAAAAALLVWILEKSPPPSCTSHPRDNRNSLTPFLPGRQHRRSRSDGKPDKDAISYAFAVQFLFIKVDTCSHFPPALHRKAPIRIARSFLCVPNFSLSWAFAKPRSFGSLLVLAAMCNAADPATYIITNTDACANVANNRTDST